MYFAETNGSLTLILEGKEQIATLKAKVVLPRKSIKNMQFMPVFKEWRNWQVRMPGTYAPKLLMAGSYWTEEGWDFVYAKKPRGFVKPELHEVLVVETDLNRYRRVIVAIPKKRAEELVTWWKSGKK